VRHSALLKPVFLKKDFQVQCWWLTAVILATWEAVIGRIVIPSQPGQKIHKTTSQQQKKLGIVACTVIPATAGSIK
jgi:hypothetical protein